MFDWFIKMWCWAEATDVFEYEEREEVVWDGSTDGTQSER